MNLGTWLIAGTPAGSPYPCRCAERKGKSCSAAWCPCAGREDWRDMPADCCSRRFTLADHLEGMRQWRAWKARQREDYGEG